MLDARVDQHQLGELREGQLSVAAQLEHLSGQTKLLQNPIQRRSAQTDAIVLIVTTIVVGLLQVSVSRLPRLGCAERI